MSHGHGRPYGGEAGVRGRVGGVNPEIMGGVSEGMVGKELKGG